MSMKLERKRRLSHTDNIVVETIERANGVNSSKTTYYEQCFNNKDKRVVKEVEVYDNNSITITINYFYDDNNDTICENEIQVIEEYIDKETGEKKRYEDRVQCKVVDKHIGRSDYIYHEASVPKNLNSHRRTKFSKNLYLVSPKGFACVSSEVYYNDKFSHSGFMCYLDNDPEKLSMSVIIMNENNDVRHNEVYEYDDSGRVISVTDYAAKLYGEFLYSNEYDFVETIKQLVDGKLIAERHCVFDEKGNLILEENYYNEED